MATMKAIQISRQTPSDSPKVQIVSLTIPKASAQHLVVQVKASAVQPSDRLNTRGGFSHTTFPRTPGRDFSGIIVDGPPERIGQAVFGTGGALLGFEVDGPHAQYCHIHEALVVPKPAAWSFVQAAAVGVPLTTAALCLHRARTTKDDAVLVIGASGAVGSAAVQIAAAMGCRAVFGAARRESADVDLVADPSLESVQKLAGGKGVDVVVDTVGNLELMDSALKQLAPRGRYTWIASPRASGATTVLGIDIFNIYRRELELIGCNSAGQTALEVGAELQRLVPLLESGAVKAPAESSLQTTTMEEVVETYQTGKGLQIIVME